MSGKPKPVVRFRGMCPRDRPIYEHPEPAGAAVGVEPEARHLLAHEYAVKLGTERAAKVLGGPWTIEEDAALRAISAALAQKPAAPGNSSGHCPDSSGHSRVESILLRAGFNPDEAARIAARAVQQGGAAR